ncbi:ABC transporter G family member 11-like [Punica granatum]|uniref:ABC transporter G family member 11-like n=1 Tax=Punica granatum TaxID=22663 RepID=A0A6P8C7W8_PUNGR|nr:ABC transporter G family member 11-like [Punica granatum]XP_031378544.1 ABC transporter G family member 11-like [Punica granatum]
MASLLNLMNLGSSRFNLSNRVPSMRLEIESSRELDMSGIISRGSGNVKNESGGVYITWEDLWVTVSNRRKGSKPILRGLTGYARPGELLAIMGPSGCGKSTLLDALAGRLNSNTRKAGDILINGQRKALAYGTSAYVMQHDSLIATLTVREAIHYSAQLQLPSSMSKAEKRERAEATILEMGLHEAADTRIGGTWGSDKGLSGGQKRRVSICLEMLTHPKLLFLDEPTSGLDSAASYYVMSRIARLTKDSEIGGGIGRTVVVCIHQPSSEVFQLFDNLCLLSSGRTVYFGPTSAANEFFALNGFPCPTLQNPSDHFLKTINRDFDMDIEKGPGSHISSDEAINTLTRSYQKSAHFQAVQRKVAEILKQEAKDQGIPAERKHAGFLTQCSVLTRRSCLNMYRDKGYYWLRLAIYITLTAGLGTLFYDIGSTYGSIQARGALIMFVASFLTFMSIGGFPSFVEDMNVFGRERLNGHYGASAFVVSNTFASAPYLLLISLIPGVISYYLPGLQKGLDHYVCYMLVLFACMMLVESLMMIVASLVPNYLMGIIVGAGIQGLMMLGGGFFRLPDDLPGPFWRYPLYYISFHRYAYQGMFKNEFEGLVFPSQPGCRGGTINGDQILRDIWEVDMGHSKWVDLGVLLGMIVVYRLIFLGIIKTNEVVRPRMATLMAAAPEQATHAMESPTCPPK